MITARGGLRLARAIVDQRTNPGIAVYDVSGGDGLTEIDACGFADIGDFLRGRGDIVDRPLMVGVGGADQCEIILIGNGKEDAAVGVLAEIGLRRFEQLADHDVRSSY